LRNSITKPIPYRGKVLSINLSIGIATYPQDGATLDQLIDKADSRMYSEKLETKTSSVAWTKPSIKYAAEGTPAKASPP
jgi:GGDEF domain-containing protein